MVGLAAQIRRTLESLDPTNFKHKRWRDGKGVVHDLEAHKMGGLASGITWVSVCGKHEPSSRRFIDDDTPVTCLLCFAKARPEHGEDCALFCPNHGPEKKCRTLHHCDLCSREG